MVDKVNPSPSISSPFSIGGLLGVVSYLASLSKEIIRELGSHANRLNMAIVSDGTEAMNAPVVLKTYTVATVPNAATWARGLIYVSDETGGAVPAFSDGTNWRRVTDRSIVS